MSLTPGSPKRGAAAGSNPRSNKLTQRDMDSSCHRLSRVPQKFSTSKAVQAEKAEPFAVSYFKNNPEAAQDIRPPDEKLQEIETSLEDAAIDPAEKFALLVQQKALRFINYGESSPEALMSYVAIGVFYNEQSRPESAIRHLTKAKSLHENSNVEIDPLDDIQIAVELANAHLSYKTPKHTREALNALQPHLDDPIEDNYYSHLRDLAKARCYNYLGRFEEAHPAYDLACKSYHVAHEYEQTHEEYSKNSHELQAKLYVEAANNAEQANQTEAAQQFYQEAYNIYKSLGNTKMCEALEDKLPPPKEENTESEEKPPKTEETPKEAEETNDEQEQPSEQAAEEVV